MAEDDDDDPHNQQANNDDDEEEDDTGGAGGAGDDTMEGELADPDEKTYCYCGQVSFGQMVGCDGEDCEKEWVSLSCSILRFSLNFFRSFFLEIWL